MATKELYLEIKSSEELKEIYTKEFKPAYEKGNLKKASEIYSANKVLDLSREELTGLLTFVFNKYKFNDFERE